MLNPFTYGKEVTGDDFCNRHKEISELTRDVKNSQNVLIFSQRRFGKTSLIKKVLDKCSKSGIIVIYVDLYPALTEEDFVRMFAKSTADSLVGNIKNKFNLLSGFFSKIKPNFTVDRDGQINFSINLNREEIVPSLEDVLSSLNRYVTKKKKKAVVCFDEFQQIGQFETDRLEKILRASIQSQNNVAYFFMGSKKHLISNMFNNPNRPFYRSAKAFPLNKIDKAELFTFITGKFAKTGKKIPSDLVNRVIENCESHPYYIQYFCHILWELCLNKKEIKENDLTESMELLINRESSTFEATWNVLTVKQKQVLIAIATKTAEQKLFSHRFLNGNNLGSASSVQRAIQSLLEKDLIDKEGVNLSIIDVFFRKWINNILAI